MTDLDDTTNDQQRQRHEQVRAVVRDCISRRAAGESVSDQELIDANFELMPELGDKLRTLQVIESAHRQVDDEKATSRDRLNVRCPECHNPMAVSDDTPVSDIVCPGCGGRFGLDDEESEIHAGASVGHFELLSKLGSGAFGSVWCARDTELDRLVAVKIPRQSRLTQDQAEQFIREARATAQLTHPNIVRIHEVGREGGVVYLVTDLVHGHTLADWMIENRVTPREVATLCATLADALHHAHEQGVIHRDLKPSNIMLDEKGKPHLMDFGLAKRAAGEATMTVDGKLLGTPAYMSPEQARGTAHSADARSDVYSLGVILFQLLTGELPFRGNIRMLIHQVLHEDAPSLRRLNRHVAPDLETICLKCLEKDPRRRYSTAQEVRDELNRYLSGQSIVARPVSRAERLWKWCRRNPVTAVLTTALAAALVMGLLGVSWQLVNTRAEAERYRRLVYVSDISKIAESWESGNVGVALRLLKRHMPDPGERDLRGFEWSLLWKRCQPSLLAGTLEREPVFAAFVMAVAPNGGYLAAAGGPGTVVVWDLDTDKILHRLKGHDITFGLAFSPDSQTLASSGWDDKTCLWNVATGQQIGELPRGRSCVRFSHDGKLLAICAREVVSVWDVSNFNNMQERTVFQAPDVIQSAAFSLDDSVLACAGGGGRIWQWSITSEAPIEPPLEGHTDIVNTVAFSPDGKTLVSGGNDNTVRLWDIDTRQELQSFVGHRSYVRSAAFSPDGCTVASVSHDGTAKLWDVESGRLRDTFRGHDFQV